MSAKPVEWVMIVYYGPEAHRATYGRQVRSTRYTKDFIQLSRKPDFLDAVRRHFPHTRGKTRSVPLTFCWPNASARGELVLKSADRPHLKWETSQRAPRVWKMARSPTDTTPETIPGDPSHMDFKSAENERTSLKSRGAGQPYLMAIKLLNEPATLHLRAYLGEPSRRYAWADLRLVPPEIQALAAKTTQRSALRWATFAGGGVTPGALQGQGLFFDPNKNHDAWSQSTLVPRRVMMSVDKPLDAPEARFAEASQGDAAAETSEVNPQEVLAFSRQIKHKNFAVPDSTATTKTRGSAQKAFAVAVKANYGYRCAITGVATKDFLVASHIVPWSKDQSIRLDPSNGICLSLFMGSRIRERIPADWGRSDYPHRLGQSRR